jgi:capsular polysaccharide biosynthesis protein
MSSARMVGRQIVPAVLIAVLVSLVTWSVAITRPTEHEARVDLLASPRLGNDPTTLTSFPGVAGQMLPAIIDAAHSPTVLAKASGATAGAPSAAELSKQVVVDVIPASLLTRISVRARSPTVARQLALTIATEVVAKDLIAPIGDLRPVDTEPQVVEVAPDELLAAGLSIFAGAAAGVAVLVLIALVRPARRHRVKRALALTGVPAHVAVVDCGEPSAIAELKMLALAAARPVRVVGLTPSAASSVMNLSADLASAGVPMADGASDDMVSVVGVVAEAVVEKLTGALAALPAHAQLIAIALTASRHRRYKPLETDPRV